MSINDFLCKTAKPVDLDEFTREAKLVATSEGIALSILFESIDTNDVTNLVLKNKLDRLSDSAVFGLSLDPDDDTGVATTLMGLKLDEDKLVPCIRLGGGKVKESRMPYLIIDGYLEKTSAV